MVALAAGSGSKIRKLDYELWPFLQIIEGAFNPRSMRFLIYSLLEDSRLGLSALIFITII
jgi:hypothetical protein